MEAPSDDHATAFTREDAAHSRGPNADHAPLGCSQAPDVKSQTPMRLRSTEFWDTHWPYTNLVPSGETANARLNK
jgi:hypothetical protein